MAVTYKNKKYIKIKRQDKNKKVWTTQDKCHK